MRKLLLAWAYMLFMGLAMSIVWVSSYAASVPNPPPKQPQIKFVSPSPEPVGAVVIPSPSWTPNPNASILGPILDPVPSTSPSSVKPTPVKKPVPTTKPIVRTATQKCWDAINTVKKSIPLPFPIKWKCLPNVPRYEGMYYVGAHVIEIMNETNDSDYQNRSVVAHELGHAWQEKLGGGSLYNERLADQFACAWGYCAFSYNRAVDTERVRALGFPTPKS